MATVEFETVDVFTVERFRGNPLAVIRDARGLSDAAMQSIAVEFGYSEITFVFPPDDAAHDARVRIFTPSAEVPCAGHPNVGTAYVRGQQAQLFGKPLGERLLFEEGAGLVEVVLERQAGHVVGAAIRAPRALHLGSTVPVALLAECVGLQPDQVATDRHLPQIASVGLGFIVAELRDPAALAAARPNRAVFEKALQSHPTDENDFAVFLYVRDDQQPRHLRARMFAPLDNVAEDPATGSASGALCAFLTRLDPCAEERVCYRVEQGVEMGRRSLIDIIVEGSAREPRSVTIAGRCVSVMNGRIAC